jgi:hypothetical protein
MCLIMSPHQFSGQDLSRRHFHNYTLHIVPIAPLCHDARQMNGVGQVAGQEDWRAKDGIVMNQEYL